MGRAPNGRGGARGKAPSRFGRNLRHHIKCVMKEDKFATAGQLVDRLRSTYGQYSRLELQPFTKYVREILHSHPIVLSSSAASSGSGVGSSEVDEVTTSESDGCDLMKSMIRERYCAETKKLAVAEGDREVMEFDFVEKSVNLVDSNGGRDGVEIGKGKERNGTDETNRTKFEDLGGMDEVIRRLDNEVIFPMDHPEVLMELGMKPVTGILLCGPPGCGKTMLAEAIANEAGVPFYKICATSLVSGVSGGSEENIRELFSKAQRTVPSVVFIDEIDAIASKRGDLQREMERRTVIQLMSCMDEVSRLARPSNRSSDQRYSGYVLVIGATNRPDAIEPALRRSGRFDREYALGVPDEEARFQILTTHTNHLKVDGGLDLRKVATSTSGFVGADLAALVDNVKSLAWNRIADEKKALLSREEWRTRTWSDEELKKISIAITDFEEARKMVQPTTKREGFSDLPNVKWDDVGGLHSLKEELNLYIVNRIKYPRDYEEFGLNLETGILLYGPPGCGKTLIAQAVANEAGANLIYIKGPEVLNKYVGESESAVRTIFSRARSCTPCIIFFDEVDILTRRRGAEGAWVVEGPLVSLLVELAAAEQRRGIYVIGATNRPDAIDEALLRQGRFGKLLYVPLPSPDERGMILKALTGKRKIDDTVDLMALGKDNACNGFSGADLSKLMEEASLAAMRDKQASSLGSSADFSPRTILNEHFNIALKKVSSSVSEKQKRYYRRLSKRLKSELELS